jgi:hypothetical protein
MNNPMSDFSDMFSGELGNKAGDLRDSQSEIVCRCDNCKWLSKELIGSTKGNICDSDDINRMVTGAMFPVDDFYCKFWEPKL